MYALLVSRKRKIKQKNNPWFQIDFQQNKTRIPSGSLQIPQVAQTLWFDSTFCRRCQAEGIWRFERFGEESVMYPTWFSQTAESPHQRMRNAGGSMIERYCLSHWTSHATFLVLTSRSRGHSRIAVVEKRLSAV